MYISCCYSVTKSCLTLCNPPWTVACQASLSLTVSQSLPKFMSIELVMPSNHFILCDLLFLPSVFPSTSLFQRVIVCIHVHYSFQFVKNFLILPLYGMLLSASQFSSVTQSCPTLYDPVDCSIPGFPIHYPTPRGCSNTCPSSWWCHPTSSSSAIPFSSSLQSFPASGSFLMSWLLASGGQSTGASVSSSVLPMNIQDWFL